MKPVSERAAVNLVKHARKSGESGIPVKSLGDIQPIKRDIPFKTHKRHRHAWLKGFTHSICSVCGQCVEHGNELPEHKL